jgi:hypothetical protein
MRVIVEQIACIKVERHFTHTLEIDSKEYALILEDKHEQYCDIEEWVQDQVRAEHVFLQEQELRGDYVDLREDWLEDRIESVEIEEEESAE